MGYRLCIDSGGTKISLALYQDSSLIEEERIYFEGNLLTDFSGVVDKYVSLISKYCDYQDIDVLIGAAGILTLGEKVASEITTRVKQISFVRHCEIIADVFLSALSNFKYNNGLLYVLGTGSAFVKKADLNFDIIGGYGYLLGDEGSGYDYGNMLLREYLALKDENITDELTIAIEKFYGLTSQREIIKQVMASPRYEISRLCAEFIDQKCANHITLRFLVKMIETIKAKKKATDCKIVILDGSVTKSIEVRKMCSNCDFIKIADRPMTEAVLYYKFK